MNGDRRETRFIVVASIIFLLLAATPLAVGYQSQTADSRFGGAVFDRPDYAVHRAAMNLGLAGEWRYRFQFSGQDQQGAFVKQFYILLGHIARLTRIEPEYFYLIALLTGNLFLCLAVFRLARELFPTALARRAFFLLALWGSGLGWLQLLIGWLPSPEISPIDFWLVDIYPFFGMLLFPHFSIVLALDVLMLSIGLQFLSSPTWRAATQVASIGVAAQLIQPYSPLVIDVVLGALLIFGWAKRTPKPLKTISVDTRRQFVGLGLIASAQTPLLLYTIWVFQTNPAFRQFGDQNITLTPPYLSVLLGVGAFIPAAMIGLPGRPTPTRLAAIFWLIFAFALAYFPWNLQRRFLAGITLPLAALCVLGLQKIHSRLPEQSWVKRRTSLLLAVFIVLSGLSSSYLVAGTSWYLSQKPTQFFDPIDLVDAIVWLEDRGENGDLVLASERTSLVVVAQSNLRVFSGHPIETLGYTSAREQVEQFYSGQLNLEWLQEGGIDWVIYGPFEPEHTEGFPDSEILQSAFQSGAVQIFRVLP